MANHGSENSPDGDRSQAFRSASRITWPMESIGDPEHPTNN